MSKAVSWLPLLLAAQFASSSIALAADPTQDALNAVKTGNVAAAQDAYQKMAQSGDPKVQAAIGTAFFDGIGVPLNHPAAMPFLLKAAAQGRPDAEFRLGEAYNHTWKDSDISGTWNDPPQDHDLAAKWYEKAARDGTALLPSGDPEAEITVAKLMKRRLGGLTSNDDDKIQSLVLAAAQQGNIDAEDFYASRYFDSKTPNGRAIWTKWVRKAAIAGDPEAMVSIAEDLIDQKDRDHALLWLKKAAQLNDADAPCMMKHFYNMPVTCVSDPTPEQKQEDQESFDLMTNPNRSGASQMAQDDASSQKQFKSEMDLFGIIAIAMAAKIASQPPRTEAQIKASNDQFEEQIDKEQKEQELISCEQAVNDGQMMWCPN